MYSSVSNPITASTGIPGTTEAGPVHSSHHRPADETPSEPNSMRRKTNSRAAAPVLSDPASVQKQNQITGEGLEIHSQRIKRRLIDFRTGTPAFMAVCVLNIETGTPYHHHFFDNLESFFWLLLWCTAAHLDEGKMHPTPAAQDTLNELNRRSSSLCELGSVCFLRTLRTLKIRQGYSRNFATNGPQTL
ncbi:hypothetical protein ACGC1H_005484 [Rhizoctonia solani]